MSFGDSRELQPWAGGTGAPQQLHCCPNPALQHFSPQQCLFLVWCMAPVSWNGSQVLYHNVIRPCFLKHHRAVDSVFSDLSTKALDAASAITREGSAGSMPPLCPTPLLFPLKRNPIPATMAAQPLSLSLFFLRLPEQFCTLCSAAEPGWRPRSPRSSAWPYVITSFPQPAWSPSPASASPAPASPPPASPAPLGPTLAVHPVPRCRCSAGSPPSRSPAHPRPGGLSAGSDPHPTLSLSRSLRGRREAGTGSEEQMMHRDNAGLSPAPAPLVSGSPPPPPSKAAPDPLPSAPRAPGRRL